MPLCRRLGEDRPASTFARPIERTENMTRAFAICAALILLSDATVFAEKKTLEDRYPNGSLKVQREVNVDARGRVTQNGLETAYFGSGKKQSETTYRDGVKDGPWREYFPNGKVKT